MFRTLFRLALVCCVPLISSDSIIFNQKLIWFYYNTSQSYLYTAAKLDHKNANLAAYEDSSQRHYLKKAANLGSAEAAYRQYKLARLKEDIGANTWLGLAIRLGHVDAQIRKLQSLVKRKHWVEASSHVIQYFPQGSVFTLAQQTEIDKLKQIIEVALAVGSKQLTETAILVNSPEIINETSLNGNKRIPNRQKQRGCVISADILVASEALQRSSSVLIKQFTQLDVFDGKVCFNAPKREHKLQGVCNEDVHGRIDCNVQKLASLYQSHLEQIEDNIATHLLVVVEKGEANTRGGLMYIDGKDSLSVLRHEVAHWLDFYDEYQIHPTQQQILCQTLSHKKLGNNLVIAKKSLPKDELEVIYKRPLYQAATCVGSAYQAYKYFEEPSFMEYLDQKVTSNYLSMIQSVSAQSYPPAAMNFALAFKSKPDDILSAETKAFYLQQYEYWLEYAGSLDFLPAIRMLAQLKVSTEQYLEADALINKAALGGDPTAQVLLGHFYIDAVWLEQDLNLAAFWYKQAADQYDPYGLYFYGKCLENGWGCEQDVAQAFTYYQKAFDAGSHLAAKRLNRQH